MKIKNTAPGGRGFTAGEKNYEWAAGETLDVPDAVIKDARLDPVHDGWFTDGTLVEAGKSAPAPKAEVDKGKPTK